MEKFMLAKWNRVWMASAIPALLFSSAALAQIKGNWVDPPSDLSAQAPSLDVKPLANVETTPSQPVRTSVPELAARPANEPELTSTAVQSMPGDPLADFSLLQETMQNWKLPPPNATVSKAAQPTRESAPPLPSTMNGFVQRSLPARQVSTPEQNARNLAQNYLSVWSASNYQTIRATPDFYGSEVRFHGRLMSIAALLAEKRRFVQRWPNRRYRYEPGAMGVKCNAAGTSCIVRSTFAFDASNAKLGRRSRGVGAHELVVNFAGNRPVIASENSRVLRRGSRL
jgi:hypothetical protein